MTIKELIKELSKFPDDLCVCYPSAYSRGRYSNVTNVTRGVNELDCLVVLDDYVEDD